MAGRRRDSGGVVKESRFSEPSRIRISAAIITDENGRILVVRKRDTVHFIQPGGKLDAGESPLAALARELKEEPIFVESSLPMPRMNPAEPWKPHSIGFESQA